MTEICKTRILVVDDDHDMLATISDLLTHAGFAVDTASSGGQMREAMGRSDYGMLLLDLRLRAEDGLTLARELRATSNVPIIMISGSSDETDRILLLELAADDFLIKPFSPRDLLARVRAVLRRSSAAPVSAVPRAPVKMGATPREILKFGAWSVDLKDRELIATDGSPCPLTPAEFRLLEAFVCQPRRIWTRDQLLEHTRSLETEVFDRTIDVLILRLRRKIEPNPRHPKYICTERGIGYVFAAEVTRH